MTTIKTMLVAAGIMLTPALLPATAVARTTTTTVSIFGYVIYSETTATCTVYPDGSMSCISVRSVTNQN